MLYNMTMVNTILTIAAFHTTSKYTDLYQQPTNMESSGINPIFEGIVNQMNSGYLILKTLVFIAALCCIYLGMGFFVSARGGQQENKGKDNIKKGVVVILIMSLIGAGLSYVYTIATTLKFA